jgi:glycosyltransferase involved in cell wall biosynthesis
MNVPLQALEQLHDAFATVAPADRIAVIIPCYRVASTIAGVLQAIGPEVWRIYCVDDASPDETLGVLRALAERDPRIKVMRRRRNGGVGAAVMAGFRAATSDGAAILVKIDGDGQMNPAFVGQFAAPILNGEADYVKGNRFFALEPVRHMPVARLIGNAGLSFLSKLSSGYWELFDPTNGYIALHADVAALLPMQRIHPRYFFESDMLFRLSTIGARVVELPIETVYGDEKSNLSELRCLATFPLLHLRNFAKRIFYNYFLRNFSIASLNLVLGMLLLAFGAIYGALSWIESASTGDPATAGTVMLSALPFITGMQLILNFLSYDIAMTPKAAIHPRIGGKRMLVSAG